MPQPFFSLIVPCYNDGRYRAGDYLDRLLTSVTESNLSYDDIEVILADDHSPKPYTRVISKFQPFFKIKQIETAYRFAPGNTRQVGTMIAQGQWICFADHDDTFYPRALRTVKDLIENSAEELFYVHGDFDKVSQDDLNNIVETFYGTDNNALCFVHGKFYHYTKFWKAFHLNFPKDMKTHEDVALGHQVECVMRNIDHKHAMRIPTPIYRWTNNGHSISNTKYNDEPGDKFLERAFDDYLRSSLGQFIERCEMGQINQKDLTVRCLPFILNTWFQLASFQVSNPENYNKDNFNHLRKYWNNFKRVSRMSTPVIKLMLAQGMGEDVFRINKTAEFYHLPGLDEWIQQLDQEGEPSE